jgi:cell division inhibitor SepF
MKQFNVKKIHKWWMGPDEKHVNEGFDDLFDVGDDYQIPAPTKTQKQTLQAIEEQRHQGMDETMDNIFSRGFNKHASNARTPLQLVQNPTGTLNIVVVEPRSFEDSVEIVNHLKARKSVIVNLQYLDSEISQRVIDFVSGATFAMDGTQERVGNGVFIFASINCTVETDSEGAKAYKDLFAKTFGA